MIELRQVLLTLLAAVVLGSGAVLSAHAQDTAPASAASSQSMPTAHPWSSLSAVQRDLLAPLQPTWDTFSPRRQERMLKRAERWATLPTERRAAIREHIAHWQQMTPEERARARANRNKFHDMSPQQRRQLHATFEHFQQLPPTQRAKLIRQWRALTPEQRLHWSAPPSHGQAPGASPGQPAIDHPQPPEQQPPR
jgi:hypothetical protein